MGFTLNERPGHSTSIDQLADDLKRLLKNSKPADNNEIIQSIDVSPFTHMWYYE